MSIQESYALVCEAERLLHLAGTKSLPAQSMSMTGCWAAATSRMRDLREAMERGGATPAVLRPGQESKT